MQSRTECQCQCGFEYVLFVWSDCSYSSGSSLNGAKPIHHDTCPECWRTLEPMKDRVDVQA